VLAFVPWLVVERSSGNTAQVCWLSTTLRIETGPKATKAPEEAVNSCWEQIRVGTGWARHACKGDKACGSSIGKFVIGYLEEFRADLSKRKRFFHGPVHEKA
jgi:hypothetical protein